ncbi:histone deacetylation protein Rxt3-domain-containing protein [Syncephalastrum racemosum]|uniref:Histone deacetylation protein Rxt3-domain-containing protein n=1 Tax=Syncephalastrum racemosum TaxID=13706 RepID=A0A1X2H0B8_SYNRA|nr:histone deacetylation protein Rxt3-domain-containing protein [Syncephalastrum racemosum]
MNKESVATALHMLDQAIRNKNIPNGSKQNHTPAAPSPASGPRMPSVVVRSDEVWRAAKEHEERYLGMIQYEPGRLLPPCDGQTNCIFKVHVDSRHVTYDNNQVQQSALWGTDIYTDDSDIVAMCIHSGKYLPKFVEPDIDPKDPKFRLLLGDDISPVEQPAANPPNDKDLIITVRILPKLKYYQGTIRNYTRSRNWGNHDGMSFYVENVEPRQPKEQRKSTHKCVGRRALKANPTLAAEFKTIRRHLKRKSRRFHLSDDDEEGSENKQKSRLRTRSSTSS